MQEMVCRIGMRDVEVSSQLGQRIRRARGFPMMLCQPFEYTACVARSALRKFRDGGFVFDAQRLQPVGKRKICTLSNGSLRFVLSSFERSSSLFHREPLSSTPPWARTKMCLPHGRMHAGLLGQVSCCRHIA